MYNSIALGGGGSRGYVHAGALRALLEVKGNLEFPDGIYGQSIGAVFAVALAFRVPLDTIERLARTHLKMSYVLPDLRMDHLAGFTTTYGLFSMDLFEERMLRVFDDAGIDIRDKLLRDAPQKVYLTTSNVSTGKPCLLTGDVPILKALRCSACIPFVFRPEMLYGQMYVDGAIYSRSIRFVVPSDTLVLQISTGEYAPTDLGSYVYALTAGPAHQYKSDNMIVFERIPTAMMGDATDEEITTMFQLGYSQARAWLAERLPQEGKEA